MMKLNALKPTRSIKWHIIILVFFSGILMLGTSSVITYTLVTGILQDNGEQELDRTSGLIAKYLVPSLQFSDKDSAKEIMSQGIASSPIIEICLYDQNDELFVGASKHETETMCDKAILAPQISSDIYQRVHNVRDSSNEYLGKLFVIANFDNVKQSLASIKRNYYLICLVLLFLSVVMAFLSHPILSRRIIKLSKFARQVATDGDYSERLADQHNDEIGILAKNFNLMLETIESQKVHLVKEKQRAEEANQSKSDFLANMSHELRTPMHAIINFTDIVLNNHNQIDQEKQVKYLTNVKKSASRLIVLLNDLLDLAKMQASKMRYEFHNIAVEKSVDQCKVELHSLVTTKSQALAVNIIGEQRLIEADEFRLQQVLINLLSNAIKFSPENTEITFEIDYSDTTHIAIRLIDQGTGVPEDELDSIFDEFIQSKTVNSGAGGTGLGLAISKQIIEAHNGTIIAKNNTDKGLTITIRMPYEHDITT